MGWVGGKRSWVGWVWVVGYRPPLDVADVDKHGDDGGRDDENVEKSNCESTRNVEEGRYAVQLTSLLFHCVVVVVGCVWLGCCCVLVAVGVAVGFW